MTRDEIMKMEAGPELDALVAEKVMGWHREKQEGSYRDNWVDSDNRFRCGASVEGEFSDCEDFHCLHWHPSESILWAWEVAEKIGGLHLMEYTSFKPSLWRAAFGDFQSDGETAPLAICRAALLAMEDSK